MLKGLHNRIKGYLGDDYYRLYVEPVTMNQVFEAWYKEREPGLRMARILHAQALESGFDKMTETHRTVEVLLPGTEGNRALVAQLAALQARQSDDAVGGVADGQGQTAVYEKMVDIGSAYLILPAQTATIKEQRLAVQAVAVQKQAYAAVLSEVASKVPVEFSAVSVYDRKDLAVPRKQRLLNMLASVRQRTASMTTDDARTRILRRLPVRQSVNHL